jgi:putative hydrolase of the HAD superfamily
LYDAHTLHARGITDFNDFHFHFRRVNAALWELYDHGKIDSTVIRQERFKQILAAFDVTDDVLCETLSIEYLHTCPMKGHLMPHAIETLEYLQGNYALSVITNGFEEIQHTKLKSGNLHRFFDHIVTSQKAGHKKPAREIFDFALELNSRKAHETIMVGDNLLTDIAGAKKASIDTVFFNPDRTKHDELVSLEICHLSELCTHL